MSTRSRSSPVGSDAALRDACLAYCATPTTKPSARCAATSRSPRRTPDHPRQGVLAGRGDLKTRVAHGYLKSSALRRAPRAVRAVASGDGINDGAVVERISATW